MTTSPFTDSVKYTYICPNCRGSFSLPLEMTCDDHRPEPHRLCDGCGGTGVVGYVSAEMAQDAGDGHSEGDPILCWTCVGTGLADA